MRSTINLRTMAGALVLWLIPHAVAQSGTAAISGIVRDSSGGAVVDASVVVEDPSIGVRRTLQTDSDGAFSAVALPPAARYHVLISKAGFSELEVTGIDLVVGQERKLEV